MHAQVNDLLTLNVANVKRINLIIIMWLAAMLYCDDSEDFMIYTKVNIVNSTTKNI